MGRRSLGIGGQDAVFVRTEGRRIDERIGGSKKCPTASMPDLIQPAKSRRARCRGCGGTIASGELRFGESLPNPYRERESVGWYHLACAACMRPDKMLTLLEAESGEIPDRAWLEQAVTVGLSYRRLPRLVRAERAPAGRAHCRLCRELIEKGTFRLALQLFEEGRGVPIGTIHVQCARAYFGTADVLDRIQRLTSGLTESDLAELSSLLENQWEPTTSSAGSEEQEPARSGSQTPTPDSPAPDLGRRGTEGSTPRPAGLDAGSPAAGPAARQ